MKIGPVTPAHHAKILGLNTEFVHWLSPLDQAGLTTLLTQVDYARQIEDGLGVLLGFSSDTTYDTTHGHKCLTWLRARFTRFFYIDRVIIDPGAHGQGLARALYADFEQAARRADSPRLVCEVNTAPIDNPRSHRFHQALGFRPLADVDYPAYNATLRYYEKSLTI